MLASMHSTCMHMDFSFPLYLFLKEQYRLRVTEMPDSGGQVESPLQGLGYVDSYQDLEASQG